MNNIEQWVQNKIAKLNIQIEPYENIIVNEKLIYDISDDDHAALSELNVEDWDVLQTSGNANDCMIHSILTGCSSTFRKLNNNNKNTIASIFRREELVKIPRINIDLLLGANFLTDIELVQIGNYYQFNILVFTPNRSNIHGITIIYETEYLLIHYNGLIIILQYVLIPIDILY